MLNNRPVDLSQEYKSKKRWIILSMSVLATMVGTSITTHAHAQTIHNHQAIATALPQRSQQNIRSSQKSIVDQRPASVNDQANLLHRRIIENALNHESLSKPQSQQPNEPVPEPQKPVVNHDGDNVQSSKGRVYTLNDPNLLVNHDVQLRNKTNSKSKPQGLTSYYDKNGKPGSMSKKYALWSNTAVTFDKLYDSNNEIQTTFEQDSKDGKSYQQAINDVSQIPQGDLYLHERSKGNPELPNDMWIKIEGPDTYIQGISGPDFKNFLLHHNIFADGSIKVAPTYEGLTYRYDPDQSRVTFFDGQMQNWHNEKNPDESFINNAPKEIQNAKNIVIDRIDTSNITSAANMFRSDKNVQSITLPNDKQHRFLSTNIRNFSSMFRDDINLRTIGGLGGAVLNGPVNLNNMFRGDSDLQNLNLSQFDTTQASDLTDMLAGDRNLQYIDLGNKTRLFKVNGSGHESPNVPQRRWQNVVYQGNNIWRLGNQIISNLNNEKEPVAGRFVPDVPVKVTVNYQDSSDSNRRFTPQTLSEKLDDTITQKNLRIPEGFKFVKLSQNLSIRFDNNGNKLDLTVIIQPKSVPVTVTVNYYDPSDPAKTFTPQTLNKISGNTVVQNDLKIPQGFKFIKSSQNLPLKLGKKNQNLRVTIQSTKPKPVPVTVTVNYQDPSDAAHHFQPQKLNEASSSMLTQNMLSLPSGYRIVTSNPSLPLMIGKDNVSLMVTIAQKNPGPRVPANVIAYGDWNGYDLNHNESHGRAPYELTSDGTLHFLNGNPVNSWTQADMWSKKYGKYIRTFDDKTNGLNKNSVNNVIFY